MNIFKVKADTNTRRPVAGSCAQGARVLIVGGALLLFAVLGGCSPSSSGGNGNGGIVRPTDREVEMEVVECLASDATACSLTVGEAFEGRTGGSDPGDWVKVTLEANTTYLISITPLSATLNIHTDGMTPETPADPNIGSDNLYTSSAAVATVHYIAIEFSTDGRYILVVDAQPEGNNSCNSADMEGDCDSDSTPNPHDSFPFNACASQDSDNDGHPNALHAIGTGNCTQADLTALMAISVGDITLQLDNCPMEFNPMQEDANTSTAATEVGVGDVCDGDVDDDDDGLIEIWNLNALFSIRNDLDGSHYDIDGSGSGSNTGCGGSGCSGYELMRSLNFTDPNSYVLFVIDWHPTSGSGDEIAIVADPASATNAGWQPIAHDTDSDTAGFQGTGFTATFEGNGNTITNLYINRSGEDYVGFIGSIGADGVVRNLGLVDVFVAGNVDVGGLAGQGVGGGRITASYSTGRVTGSGVVGGLVGVMGGTVSASYSSASVVGSEFDVGGLVGSNTSIISASYSTGSVTSTSSGEDVGGLVGNDAGQTATSYWDITTSGRLFGLGRDDFDNDNDVDDDETNQLAGQGLPTSQMRAGTGTFPDFRSVAQTAGPGTVATDRTGDFSAAWDYTANCYPRLRRWLDDGADGVIGTVDDTFVPEVSGDSDLLLGQGSPATMDGACAPTSNG